MERRKRRVAVTEREDASWPEVDRRAKEPWRVRKEISVGDLIALIMAIFAVVMAWVNLDKRLTRVEDAIALQGRVDARQDEELIRTQVRLEEQLRSVANKLDRLMERVRYDYPAK